MVTSFLKLSAAVAASALIAGGALAQGAGLQVGTAKIDITPEEDAQFPRLNAFEHEKLYVRAIALDNGEQKAALVGGDLSGIDDPVWQEASARIEAELGIAPEYLLVTPTHTHSDYPARLPGMPRYGTDFLADEIFNAVKQALEGMEPASVGYGVGESHVNVNRDTISEQTKLWTQAANFDGPVDRDLNVLWFTDAEGAPIAAHLTYAMHPVDGYLAGFVSGDFPAATSRYVERAFGDDMVAIFAQGASGDLNPRWLRTGTNAMAARSGQDVSGYEMVREDIEAPIRSGEKEPGIVPEVSAHQLGAYMEALGTILGEEAIRVMSDPDSLNDNPRIWGAETTLTCPGRKRLDKAREGVAGEYEDGDDKDIRLGLLGIGDVALTTANAEIYTRIGMRVKDESPMANTVFVGIGNGKADTGYIPDDAAFGHYTFQVLGSRLKPGCAEDGITDGIAGLVSEYLSAAPVR